MHAVPLQQARNRRKEIAGQGRVKVSTVRMQVKSMLAKAGCRRQAELVRLCAGLATVTGHSTGITDGSVSKYIGAEA